MTVHELNVPVDAVDAAVMALMNSNIDKVQQAKERPSLQGWFVGQAMKQFNGAVSRERAEVAVAKALQ